MNYCDQYRVSGKGKLKLKDWDPNDTDDIKRKKVARESTQANATRLTELQYRLYAESRRSVLIVLQAMDAGGKDGTIRHVMGPLNPQGCRVTSFKKPTEEELAHDFLWRIHRSVPRQGEIGVFNRSHYEDVLVVRVHDIVPKTVWQHRYQSINAFEKMLARSGVHVLKFYLHISPEEQLERLHARLDDPNKHWKVNPEDFTKRKHWQAYTAAYEDALSKCASPDAPWFVIPANKKWFRNFLVSQILVETLEGLDLQFPTATCDIAALKKTYAPPAAG